MSTSVEREEEIGAAPNLQKDADDLLAEMGLEEVELSVLLCGDERITALNEQWRGVSAPTDVLSFPQDDDVVLGDLVISVDTATRQALERGHHLSDEIRILLLHGLLHLLGYDHELGRSEHEEMAAKEEELMSALGWQGAGLIERAFEQAEPQDPH